MGYKISGIVGSEVVCKERITASFNGMNGFQAKAITPIKTMDYKRQLAGRVRGYPHKIA